MCFDKILTQVPKPTQYSTYIFDSGWTVVSTATMVEANQPRTEQDRAIYLGKAAE